MNEALRHEIVQRHQAGEIDPGHRPGRWARLLAAPYEPLAQF